MTTDQQAEEHGYWGEHTHFPVKDWQYEVANDDTRRGYWEWASVKYEQMLEDGDADD